MPRKQKTERGSDRSTAGVERVLKWRWVKARRGESMRGPPLHCTIAVASIVITGSLLPACGSASEPLRPLSSLGHLLPAPNPGKLGPELVPIPSAPPLGLPASTVGVAKGEDGIKCEQNERLAFHIHVHLTAFVNGKPRRIPAGIGIWPLLQAQSGRVGQFEVTQGECLSWVATHFPDGIIHVEAPF
jgi:hypothetical protein